MDHYKTLQVTRDAEPEVVERAYKALCLKHHPDHAPRSRQGEATRKMQRINAAYETLRDPAARARYDATLPPEGGEGWGTFLDDGLIGLFKAARRQTR